MAVRRFEGLDHATLYAKCRPKPPPVLIQAILEYLGLRREPEVEPNGKKWGIAVDVGCGTGQCTSLLSPHFKRVYGYDVSEAQVKEATLKNEHSNIEYKASPAESLPLPSACADLVTCSQCFHWFDQNRFYAEVQRVLKPGGVLAAFGYRNAWVELVGHPENEAIRGLITRRYQSPVLEPFFDRKELDMVGNKYRDIEFPLKGFLRREGIMSTIETNAAEMLFYFKSWASVQKALKSDPQQAEAALDEFKSDFSTTSGTRDLEGTLLESHFEFFLLMGYNSQSPDS
jgi:ubiquinone/menaquinone biosynthesis C-methylase UbiE